MNEQEKIIFETINRLLEQNYKIDIYDVLNELGQSSEAMKRKISTIFHQLSKSPKYTLKKEKNKLILYRSFDEEVKKNIFYEAILNSKLEDMKTFEEYIKEDYLSILDGVNKAINIIKSVSYEELKEYYKMYIKYFKNKIDEFNKDKEPYCYYLEKNKIIIKDIDINRFFRNNKDIEGKIKERIIKIIKYINDRGIVYRAVLSGKINKEAFEFITYLIDVGKFKLIYNINSIKSEILNYLKEKILKIYNTREFEYLFKIKMYKTGIKLLSKIFKEFRLKREIGIYRDDNLLIVKINNLIGIKQFDNDDIIKIKKFIDGYIVDFGFSIVIEYDSYDNREYVFDSIDKFFNVETTKPNFVIIEHIEKLKAKTVVEVIE